MSFQQRLSQLDRVQRHRGFKIAMSVVILVAMVILAGYAIFGEQPVSDRFDARIEAMPAEVENVLGDMIPNPDIERARQIKEIINNADPSTIILYASITGGLVLILVVWLNLGIVYPFLALLGFLIFLAGQRFGFPVTGGIALGMTSLALIFMLLMRAAVLALGYAHPVFTIARNVLAEAVRMKISMVLIVLLFFALATLPMVLEGDESLRYRVQGFLQYSTGFTYLFTALLVVFFGAATVSYEQREKVIWQTMTKPVAAWQYLLGKWLGVSLLAAILLGVSALGVIQFTEFLRNQPAQGELSPFVALDGSELTEDRLKLESEILAARVARTPVLPMSIDSELFDQAVEIKIANERISNPSYDPDAAERAVLREQVFRDEYAQYFSIDPRMEQYEEFTFAGLSEAKARNLPLTLRYKIDAEGNRPDITYILTFVFPDGTILPPRRTGLGFSHSMQIPSHVIDNQGVLRMQIYNGQLIADGDLEYQFQGNVNTFTIPPDGLEVSYSVGSYRANFFRVYFVLWVKLALLAMLAVWASTFASFPVACLIAGGLFFMGETSGFVQGALPGWGKTNVEGDPSLYRTIIYHLADNVSSVFTVYNELRPTKRIAEGELLSWGRLTNGVVTLGVVTLVFFGLGTLIFRRRQLALYSGN